MTLYVVRHAMAEDKAGWADDDALRPLAREGLQQAAALPDWFGPGIDLIASSPTVRCIATVLPLARRLHLDPVLKSDLLPGREAAAAELARALMDTAESVLCTHGEVIPAMLGLLGVRCRGGEPTSCEKGSIWKLEHQPDGGIAGWYHPTQRAT